MVRTDVALQEVPERRRATRYLVQIPVTYLPHSGSMRDTILDISTTGASIEGAPPHEQLGGALVLHLDCFGIVETIGLAARLVRLTERGFAVEFTEPDPFLRVLLKIAMLHIEQREAGVQAASAGRGA